MKQFALVGKPNSGKSSLFNLLTGLNQKIGNYSGVTIEKKSGKVDGMDVVDLPGIRSLKSVTAEEFIPKKAILEYADSQAPVLFVCNGMMLEDNMMLFTEMADLQIPMVLVINFKDDLEKNNIEVDAAKMAVQVGCPVILMNSRNGDGMDDLKKAIKENKFQVPNAVCRSLYDEFSEDTVGNNFQALLTSTSTNKSEVFENDFIKRQKIVNNIIDSTTKSLENRNDFLDSSRSIDKILLHPVWGLLIFLAIILVLFQSVFFLSGYPMDWIDAGFASLSELANNNISSEWLASLVSDGIIAGLGGVLIFIPQIAILFFFLSVLEQSGYLSRISFLSDRVLSKFGLSGQSVIPLMSSWACAIPAIMSAKTITDTKERMAVIFASPLMTCSARLPVYTILIAIMFPSEGTGFFNAQGVMLFGLYLLGLVATLLVAYLTQRRSTLKTVPLFSLELPVYRIPNWRNVFYNVYQKTKSFVVDAGKVIFVVSIILWFLLSYSPKKQSFLDEQYQISQTQNQDQNISRDAFDLEYSYAGYMGKFIEPVIKPLGFDWKIGIALISSFAAREVFVGALSTIYSVGSEEEGLIKTRMQNEINPDTGKKRFNIGTCLSLLLFYVFALQCMSTMAVVRKEVGNWKYPVIQFVIMLVMAYVAAWLGYTLYG